MALSCCLMPMWLCNTNFCVDGIWGRACILHTKFDPSWLILLPTMNFPWTAPIDLFFLQNCLLSFLWNWYTLVSNISNWISLANTIETFAIFLFLLLFIYTYHVWLTGNLLTGINFIQLVWVLLVLAYESNVHMLFYSQTLLLWCFKFFVGFTACCMYLQMQAHSCLYFTIVLNFSKMLYLLCFTTAIKN